MFKYINIPGFPQYLFDRKEQPQQGAGIIQAILKARSPRLTSIAGKMRGNPVANYKTIQHFLARVNPKEALLRLFQADAAFLIGDPTEIPRPQARKTASLGTFKDAKSRGF